MSALHAARAAQMLGGANARRSLRYYRKHGKAPPVLRQRFPHLLEVEYAGVLLGVVRAARHFTQPLIAALPHLENAPDRSARVHDMIEHARTQQLAWSRQQTSVVASIAHRVSTFQRAQLARQVHAMLGIALELLVLPVPTPARFDAAGPGSRIEDYVAENVSLIKSLGTTPLDQVEQTITRAFANGDRHERLAREIADRFNVADSRARLIARDQIGKLNGRLSADRNQALGLTRFTWRDVGDRRVRPLHVELSGQVFAYAKPPSEGLPGTPICCRCHDEPVMDDILAELDRLEAIPEPTAAPVLPSASRARRAPKPRVAPAAKGLEADIKAAAKLTGQAQIDRLSKGARAKLDGLGLHKREAAADRVVVSGPAVDAVPGRIAYRAWSGEIVLGDKAHADLVRFTEVWARDPAAARVELAKMTPAELFRSPADGMSVMLHEHLHGYGATAAADYRGAGVLVEELTTETMARKIMRDTFGADMRGEGGSYGRFIAGALDSIQGVDAKLTREGAWHVLERASELYKKDVPGAGAVDQRFARHLTGALGVPPGKFSDTYGHFLDGLAKIKP